MSKKLSHDIALDYINSINNENHLINQKVDEEMTELFTWAFGFNLLSDEAHMNMTNLKMDEAFIKAHPDLPPLPPISGDDEVDYSRVLFHITKWYFKTEGKDL